MSKLKNLLIEAEEIAAENYNVSRDEFCMILNDYDLPAFLYPHALKAYDCIQNEMDEYYDRMADIHEEIAYVA